MKHTNWIVWILLLLMGLVMLLALPFYSGLQTWLLRRVLGSHHQVEYVSLGLFGLEVRGLYVNGSTSGWLLKDPIRTQELPAAETPTQFYVERLSVSWSPWNLWFHRNTIDLEDFTLQGAKVYWGTDEKNLHSLNLEKIEQEFRSLRTYFPEPQPAAHPTLLPSEHPGSRLSSRQTVSYRPAPGSAKGVKMVPSYDAGMQNRVASFLNYLETEVTDRALFLGNLEVDCTAYGPQLPRMVGRIRGGSIYPGSSGRMMIAGNFQQAPAASSPLLVGFESVVKLDQAQEGGLQDVSMSVHFQSQQPYLAFLQDYQGFFKAHYHMGKFHSELSLVDSNRIEIPVIEIRQTLGFKELQKGYYRIHCNSSQFGDLPQHLGLPPFEVMTLGTLEYDFGSHAALSEIDCHIKVERPSLLGSRFLGLDEPIQFKAYLDFDWAIPKDPALAGNLRVDVRRGKIELKGLDNQASLRMASLRPTSMDFNWEKPEYSVFHTLGPLLDLHLESFPLKWFNPWIPVPLVMEGGLSGVLTLTQDPEKLRLETTSPLEAMGFGVLSKHGRQAEDLGWKIDFKAEKAQENLHVQLSQANLTGPENGSIAELKGSLQMNLSTQAVSDFNTQMQVQFSPLLQQPFSRRVDARLRNLPLSGSFNCQGFWGGRVGGLNQARLDLTLGQSKALVLNLGSPVKWDAKNSKMLASSEGPFLQGRIEDLPLGWMSVFLPQTLLEGSVRGMDFQMLAHQGAFSLEAQTPLIVEDASFTQNSQPLFQHVDLALLPRFFWSENRQEAECVMLRVAQHGKSPFCEGSARLNYEPASRSVQAQAQLSCALPALVEQTALARSIQPLEAGTLQAQATVKGKIEHVKGNVDLVFEDIKPAGPGVKSVQMQLHLDQEEEDWALQMPLQIEGAQGLSSMEWKGNYDSDRQSARFTLKGDALYAEDVLALQGLWAPQKPAADSSQSLERPKNRLIGRFQDKTLASTVPAAAPLESAGGGEGAPAEGVHSAAASESGQQGADAPQATPFWSPFLGRLDATFNTIYYQNHRLDEFHTYIALDKQAIEMKIFKAKYAGGQLDAQSALVFNPADPGYSASANAQLKGLPIGMLLKALRHGNPQGVQMTGELNGSAQLKSTAFDPKDLVRGATGSVSLKAGPGEVTGLVPQGALGGVNTQVGSLALGLLGQSMQRPGVAALGRITQELGQIPYDSLEVWAQRSDPEGPVQLQTLSLKGPKLAVEAQGSIPTASPLAQQKFELSLSPSAQGPLGQDLALLGILEPQPAADGYHKTTEPITLSGTVGHPNLSALWKRLNEAAARILLTPAAPSSSPFSPVAPPEKPNPDPKGQEAPTADPVRQVMNFFGL